MAGLGLQTDFNGVEGVLDDFAHCTCNLRHIRRDNSIMANLLTEPKRTSSVASRKASLPCIAVSELTSAVLEAVIS